MNASFVTQQRKGRTVRHHRTLRCKGGKPAEFYGLFDPADVRSQIDALRGLVPAHALAFAVEVGVERHRVVEFRSGDASRVPGRGDRLAGRARRATPAVKRASRAHKVQRKHRVPRAARDLQQAGGQELRMAIATELKQAAKDTAGELGASSDSARRAGTIGPTQSTTQPRSRK